MAGAPGAPKQSSGQIQFRSKAALLQWELVNLRWHGHWRKSFQLEMCTHAHLLNYFMLIKFKFHLIGQQGSYLLRILAHCECSHLKFSCFISLICFSKHFVCHIVGKLSIINHNDTDNPPTNCPGALISINRVTKHK